MNIGTFNPLLIILLFQHFHLKPAGAQEQFRAKISNIAWRHTGEVLEIKGKTDSVQYKRHNKPDWTPAQKKDELYDKDRVLIKPFIFAKLEMENPTAGGRFTLWGDTAETILPAAAYEIRGDPVRLGYYQLFVTYGSFVASNLRGQISSKSDAMELTPSGTRYLMTVDRETGRTFVFVDKGEIVAVASGDTIRLQPSEAAQAFPGGAPERVNLSSRETKTYQRQIQMNHVEVWKQLRPWWRSPWFYGGAAAVGAVSAGFIAWQVWAAPPSDDDNQAKGNIEVYW